MSLLHKDGGLALQIFLFLLLGISLWLIYPQTSSTVTSVHKVGCRTLVGPVMNYFLILYGKRADQSRQILVLASKTMAKPVLCVCSVVYGIANFGIDALRIRVMNTLFLVEAWGVSLLGRFLDPDIYIATIVQVRYA